MVNRTALLVPAPDLMLRFTVVLLVPAVAGAVGAGVVGAGAVGAGEVTVVIPVKY